MNTRRFLLLVATTVLLVGSTNIARRVLRPVAGDGVQWQSSERGLVARGVTGEAAVVVSGDRLMGVDGRQVAGSIDLALLNREASVGSTRWYRVERDGAIYDLEVPVVPGQAPRGYLLLAVVGLAAVFAAFRLLTAGSTVPGVSLAAASAIAFAAIALFSPVGWMDGFDRFAVVGDEVGRLLFPGLLLHSALTLAGHTVGWLWPVLYLPALVIGFGEALFLRGGTWLSPQSTVFFGSLVDRGVHYHLAVLVAVAVAVSGLSHLRSRGRERERLRWLTVAAAAGVGPYLLCVALPRALGYELPLLADLSLIPMTLVPLALANAFLRRPLELRILAASGAVFASGALLISGAALATAAIAGNALATLDLPIWPAYVAVALMIAAGFFQRLRLGLEGWIESSIDRESYEARRTLLEFGRQLAVMPQLSEISSALLARIGPAFRLSEAALFVDADDDGRFRRFAAVGAHDDLPEVLQLDAGNLGRLLGQRVRRLDQSEQGTDGGDLRRLSALVPLGFETLAPLVSRGRLVGFLALGESTTGRLGRRDRALLEDLAGYVAVAVDNARLQEELHRQTEAVRDLEQFRASVIESLSMGILIVDLEGSVLAANEAFRTLAGCDRIVSGGSAARLLPTVFHDMPAEDSTVQRAHDGRTLALSTSFLRRGDASIHGRILVVEDVTERIADERERARREKLASIGVMSAGIAHEVNTPLTGIASYVQMLLVATSEDDTRRPLLEKVEHQCFRAAGLVRNLLNFSRPSRSGPAPFDINALVTDSLSLLAHEAKRAGVAVECSLDPTLPPAVGREGEIEQVLVNLIKNAIDSMSNGGTLRLSSRSEDGSVVVSVEDEGSGISAEHLERVFDPFFTTKSSGGGHGLGLSVAYGIIKAHDGDIRIESKPGAGTRVEVGVPGSPVRVRSPAPGE